jgi:8-oxo-dGTP diphosphatase
MSQEQAREKPFGLAVKALIADDQDRILAIRRSLASKQYKHAWDLPGGKVGPGEGFDMALVREVEEETGLTVAVEGVAGATEYEMPASRLAVLVLKARWVRGEVRLSSEHDDSTWVSPADLAGLDFHGQLRDFIVEHCQKPQISRNALAPGSENRALAPGG